MICGIAVLGIGNAYAENPESDGKFTVNSASHPDAGDGSYYPSMMWLINLPSYYYRIYEEWPETWSDVEDAGLCQVSIFAPDDGTVIDPDDGTWSFPGDIAYVYTGKNTRPVIKSVGAADGTVITTREVSDYMQSYAEWFQNNTIDPTKYEGYAERTDLLTMFAIKHIIIRALGPYSIVHGHVPETWEDLLASGMMPIDENAINPLTGGPFYGDGRPNDFIYKCIAENGCDIQITDENGDTPWRGILQW
jgi:hypothetical protein